MVLQNLKCTLQNTCGMSETQIKLTILAMLTILFQGIGFYFIDKKGIRVELFMFVVIFGFLYNIMYFKTFIN
jgi:hypothetical protein